MGTVANLAVKISANASDFEKGIAGLSTQVKGVNTQMQSMVTGFRAAMASFGAVQLIKQVGDWGGQITDFSNRLQLSTDVVQKFKFAAEQSGSSLSAIARGIELFQRSLVAGGDGFVDAIRQLGLSVALLKQQSPDQAFLSLARALMEIEDPALRDALAFKALGRSGQELQQIFPTLLADMQRAPVASAAIVKASDDLGDTWDRLVGIGTVLLAYVLLPLGKSLGAIDAVIGGTVSGFQSLKAAMQNKDLGIAEALKVTEARSTDLNDRALKPLNLSLEEVARIEKDLESKMRATNQAIKEQAADADKAAKEWREYNNWIGEREIENHRLAQEAAKAKVAAEVAGIDELIEASIAYTNEREAQEAEMRAYTNELGVRQMEDEAARMKERVTMWTVLRDSAVSNITQMSASMSQSLAQMLTGTVGFKDGFLGVWRSIQSALTNILSDLLNMFIGSFLKGMLGSLLGQQGAFGAAFAGMFSGGGGVLSGIFGGLGGGGGAAGAAAGAGGAAAGGGGLMGALGGFFTNPWTIGIGAAIGGGLLLGKLFDGPSDAYKAREMQGDWQRAKGDQGIQAIQGAYNQGLISDDLMSRLFDPRGTADWQAASGEVDRIMAGEGSSGGEMGAITINIEHVETANADEFIQQLPDAVRQNRYGIHTDLTNLLVTPVLNPA